MNNDHGFMSDTESMPSSPIALAGLLALSSAVSGSTAFVPFTASGQTYYQDVSFDGSGRTLYLTQVDGVVHRIVVSRLRSDTWSAPIVVPFSGVWRDLEQTLSRDGRTMIFASNRPVAAGERPLDAFFGGKYRAHRGGNLWSVERNGSSWGEPVRLPGAVNANTSTFSPALASDGTLYFMRASGRNQRFHIFISERKKRGYVTGTLAPFSDLRYVDFDPTVASDGSFIIFGSNRPPVKPGTADLFITFHRAGRWTQPQDMGQSIDPAGDAIEPRLSPDNRTLYFTRSNAPNPMRSVNINSWLEMSRADPYMYDFQVVAASTKNTPSLDLDDGRFANVSLGIENGLTVTAMAAETNLSTAEVRKRVQALTAAGLLQCGVTCHATYPIINRQEGAWFAHLDDSVVDRVVEDVERDALGVRNRFAATLGLSDSQVSGLTLMYLSDVLFDRWQVRHIRTGFLGPPQPPRGGKIFYVAALERTPTEKTSALGLYAHQEQDYGPFTVVTFGNGLNDDPFGDAIPNVSERAALLSAYATLASGGSIMGTDLDELNALHFVADQKPQIAIVNQDKYAELHSVTETFTPTLLREVNADRSLIFKAYASSGYAPYVTFQEFALWWYHFLIVDVTQRLIAERVIEVPKIGFTTIIVRHQ